LDCAVHSLKDLPTAQPDGLAIGAVPPRGSVQDVLISRDGYTLETLPLGATVGTDSPRRAAQVRHYQPAVEITHIRGNIDTRIRKAMDAGSSYTAIVLARAGLERLGRLEAATQTLSLEQVLPAPGQGALAVQCRDEAESLVWFAPINDVETQMAVTAERAFLAGLGGGCALPVAAYAHFESGQLHLIGRVCSEDGRIRIDNELTVTNNITVEAAEQAGRALAQKALARHAEWMDA
jgi:hydroxymethylbilane synthase